MRIGALLLVVWLVIGAAAAAQRDYFSGSSVNCAKAGTIAVTVLAGPLVVQRTRQNRDGNRSCLGAVDTRTGEVVALRGGGSPDDQPHDQQKSADPHRFTSRQVAGHLRTCTQADMQVPRRAA